MGHVLLAGLFEPGVAVSLHRIEHGTVRAEGGELVGRRVADGEGTVGFDGLEPGDRFLASSYLRGVPVQVRAVAGVELKHTGQSPDQRVPQRMGTQEAPEPAQAPEQPDGLETGVPSSLQQLQAGEPAAAVEVAA